MRLVTSRVYASLPVALALLSAACADRTSSVPTAAVAEAATLVNKRSSAMANVDVTGITIETRQWSALGGLPTDAVAKATYEALTPGLPGYTYPAFPIPNVGSAPSVLITADGCAQATPVRHPGSANRDIATRITISLYVANPSSIGVRFGVDARFAVVLVDGSPVTSTAALTEVIDEPFGGPFWDGYYLADMSLTEVPLWLANPWGVMEVAGLNLSKGAHTVELIAFEDGNDWGSGGQMDLGAGYQDIIGPIPQKTLTVSKIGGGVGSVASFPTGISCGVDCDQPYAYGTTVTLTAAATPPSVFAGWSGACTGMSTSCTVTMDADRAVTAKFVTPPTASAMTMETRFWYRSGPQPTVGTAAALFESLPTDVVGYTNTPVPVVSMVPNRALFTLPYVGVDHDIATRTVISFTTPNPLVMSFRAAVDYDAGGLYWVDNALRTPDLVLGTLSGTLNLSAGTHTIVILGFEGCCDYGTGSPVVEFDYGTGWVQVTAPLPPPQRLTVTTGAAGGRVTSQPGSIDCGSTCVWDFTAGSLVTLTVNVNPGYVFAGWSGDCSGTGPCVVRMNEAKFVTANWRYNTLTVVPAGSGSGTVTSAPGGIDCGATCSASFAQSSVVLTAAPATGSVFTGWSGACSGTLPTCTVSLDESKSVTANFAVQTFALSVSKIGSGTGVVAAPSAGINCGPACSSILAYGTTVTLTATPSSGSYFFGWTGGGCSGTGPCTVTMDQARSVTASFRLGTDDTTPPVVSCKATPSVLWPVNHKLIPITVQVNLTDVSPATFQLVSVLSNEPVNGLGDGSTSPDIVDWATGTADVAGLLRAERSGNLRDRVYTLTYRGTDARGNSADASCTVTVPHDQRSK